MGLQLCNLVTSIRNMIFMRKLKGFTLFNPVDALGITPGQGKSECDEDAILDLWSPDPVHRTGRAYNKIAEKLSERITQVLEENEVTVKKSEDSKGKDDQREPWIAASQPVAKRTEANWGVRGDHDSHGR